MSTILKWGPNLCINIYAIGSIKISLHHDIWNIKKVELFENKECSGGSLYNICFKGIDISSVDVGYRQITQQVIISYYK